MRGKAWAPGVAVLLTVALAGCTGGGNAGDPDAKRGATDTTTAAAPRPGRFDTLPQPCKAVDRATLDSLLPGLREQAADEGEDAYAGTLAPTFDNERKVGCAWKAESTEAADGAGRTDSLTLDLERVVSYDAAKSDDDRARETFEKRLTAAHIPDPSPSGSPSGSASGQAGGTASPGSSGSPAGSPSPGSGESGKSGQSASSSPSSSSSADTATTPPELLPRMLSGLGNDAFLNDSLSAPSAGGAHRTVTVVFRTSNVVVGVVYQQRPNDADDVPDSKEMQDKARKLADRIAGSFEG
ncbi:hypothetical protein ACQYWQ_17865 [Streptomyces sp. P6-2-1]|uniref:hypothetical protein n=1 Tax=unclassified Streptomyces TaxID=2593676 RepID=UPI003D3675BA